MVGGGWWVVGVVVVVVVMVVMVVMVVVVVIVVMVVMVVMVMVVVMVVVVVPPSAPPPAQPASPTYACNANIDYNGSALVRTHSGVDVLGVKLLWGEKATGVNRIPANAHRSGIAHGGQSVPR